MRTGPGTGNSILMEVGRGERLVLLDRQPAGEWYNVIQIESASEGWIHASVITLVYTSKKSVGPIFGEERIDADSSPVIEVNNQSNEELNLKLGSSLYKIPAYSKRAVTLPVGAYKYYASAAGVMPAIGEHTFKIGYKYSWTFWIETKVH